MNSTRQYILKPAFFYKTQFTPLPFKPQYICRGFASAFLQYRHTEGKAMLFEKIAVLTENTPKRATWKENCTRAASARNRRLLPMMERGSGNPEVCKIKLEQAIVDYAKSNENKHSLENFQINGSAWHPAGELLGVWEWEWNSGDEKKKREDGVVVGYSVPCYVLHCSWYPPLVSALE